jgi:two-component system sensor histidine kinase BaeS
MVDPLAQVMAAADAVAEGDLDVRVKERGPGELRQLAHSFNRMVIELQRADRLRRDMMADVAHELRNPLHVLQGNLEGLQDGLYHQRQKDRCAARRAAGSPGWWRIRHPVAG